MLQNKARPQRPRGLPNNGPDLGGTAPRASKPWQAWAVITLEIEGRGAWFREDGLIALTIGGSQANWLRAAVAVPREAWVGLGWYLFEETTVIVSRVECRPQEMYL